MTTEEYRAIEREALDNLQRLHTLGIIGDNIAFVMSRDTYLAASTETNTICRAADYSENGEQTGIRSVYQGYDIFIINEESRPTFQPAVKGFQIRGVSYDQLSLGDLVLSETAEEDPRIFAKMQLAPPVFNDTGLTVSRQYERIANGRVAFADQICAGQERERQQRREREIYTPLFDWNDWTQYISSQLDSLSRPVMGGFSVDEFELQLNEVATTMRQGTEGVMLKRKKSLPVKDWDERITPEDTKELDDFLYSLARKDTLESAT